MSASKDKLYVFVKGNKGVGGFLITGPDFEEIHKDTVDGDSHTHQLYMDLSAMEKSLEYIIAHRGKDQIPKQPVVCIYTTFENNYEVMSPDPTMPREEEMKQIKQKLDSLKKVINKDRQKKDGVKYYWVPNEFEMHFDELEHLLSKHKSETKFKPR